MARIALCLLVVLAACRPAQSPVARKAGMVMAIGGVLGIMGSAIATGYSESADEVMIGFDVISATGVVLFAAHELSGPPVVYKRETQRQKLSRWARVLTEHAAGAARNGNCARVRKFEPRVQLYDPNVHDFVFMRDPEILRCLSPGMGAPPSAAIDAGLVPSPPSPVRPEAPAPAPSTSPDGIDGAE
ncbi:MAG: hypothetical protein M3680_26205 [Myxococcota bacterium]|nr:hypothetical protein [Myxococcota bacterium]